MFVFIRNYSPNHFKQKHKENAAFYFLHRNLSFSVVNFAFANKVYYRKQQNSKIFFEPHMSELHCGPSKPCHRGPQCNSDIWGSKIDLRILLFSVVNFAPVPLIAFRSTVNKSNSNSNSCKKHYKIEKIERPLVFLYFVLSPVAKNILLLYN